MALIFNIVNKHEHLDVGVIIIYIQYERPCCIRYTITRLRLMLYISDTTRPLMLFILQISQERKSISKKGSRHTRHHFNDL